MRDHPCQRHDSVTDSNGFTLVEIAVTLLLLGLLAALAVPTVQQLSGSYTLKAEAQNIAAQLRVAREKAISTGVDQPMHFNAGYLNSDYHIHYASGVEGARWSLHKGITDCSGAGTSAASTLKADGRSNAAGMVILQVSRGIRDTVSVQTSGLILNQ